MTKKITENNVMSRLEIAVLAAEKFIGAFNLLKAGLENPKPLTPYLAKKKAMEESIYNPIIKIRQSVECKAASRELKINDAMKTHSLTYKAEKYLSDEKYARDLRRKCVKENAKNNGLNKE